MRVERSFSFIDLSGFTTLTDTSGDERAVYVLNVFRALVREVCSRRGVRIAKWLGDGAMLVSVDYRPLLEALLEIQFSADRTPDTPLSIRAGATCGPVILHEGDDYIGHAVNIAARLCDVAGGGVILCEPELTEWLPPWGIAGEARDISLRGIHRPVQAVAVELRPLEGNIQQDPVCGIPLTRFLAESHALDAVGRELWFCSPSCYDTWVRRPPVQPEEHGSLRSPFAG